MGTRSSSIRERGQAGQVPCMSPTASVADQASLLPAGDSSIAPVHHAVNSTSGYGINETREICGKRGPYEKTVGKGPKDATGTPVRL